MLTAPDTLEAIPADKVKHSFEMLLDRASKCIEAEGDYFEEYKKILKNVL